MRRFLPASAVSFALFALPACDGAQHADPATSDIASAGPPARAYRGLPAGTDEGAGASLLAQYSKRDPIDARETKQWVLPGHAKRIAVALLTTAALDRLEDLPLVLADDARWGLPDRREYAARAVFAGDGGAQFLDAFRRAASRFKGVAPSADVGESPSSAAYTCPPLVPGAEAMVRTGAEPYWCFYQSDDHLDLLVFKLRVVEGHAQVEYIGMFDERPTGPIRIRNADPAPPLTPPIKMPNTIKAQMPARPAGEAGQPMVRGALPPGTTVEVEPPQTPSQ